MLTPGHQIFDPEEQLYLSRLHDGRYVLHYTDRSYYVFGDFDSDGMAYLLFMETPHRQRIVFGHEGGRLVRIASSSGHHLLLHRTQTPAGSGCRELNWCRAAPVAIWWSTGMTITVN